MPPPFANVEIHLKSMKIVMLYAQALRKSGKFQPELISCFLFSSHDFQSLLASVSCVANEVKI